MEGLRLSSTYKCTSAAKLAVRVSYALLTAPTFTSQTHSPTKKQKGEKRDFFHLSPHEGKTHNLAEHVETRSRLGAELGERLL